MRAFQTPSKSGYQSRWAGMGYPQWANLACASAAVMVASAAAMAASSASRVRAPVRRKAVVSLPKSCSIGAKSGE